MGNAPSSSAAGAAVGVYDPADPDHGVEGGDPEERGVPADAAGSVGAACDSALIASLVTLWERCVGCHGDGDDVRLVEVLGASRIEDLRALFAGCGCEQKKMRSIQTCDPVLNDMIHRLFELQDLNQDGVLSEAELVQLNKKIAVLHYGPGVDKEAVKAKFQEIFRTDLDPSGEPVPVETFQRHILRVLRGIDTDPEAQKMILEQWMVEAALGRQQFAVPAMRSMSDLAFLLQRNFSNDSLSKAVLQDPEGWSSPMAPPLDLDHLSTLSTNPDSQASSPGAWSLPTVCKSPRTPIPDVPPAPAPSLNRASGAEAWAAPFAHQTFAVPTGMTFVSPPPELAVSVRSGVGGAR